MLVSALTALPPPAGAQLANDDPQSGGEAEALVEELGRALGMTPAEIEALGLSPAEMRGLLAGFAEETVVVGSRAQPRSATDSAVPVEVLSAADLVSQGAGDLKDQLRTIVPSFSTNTQPISGVSTVVRPAMLRNLAPDHTLVLINGKRRHRSSIVDWHGGNGVAFGSQGPDISAIPAIALRQVEVLRDGAAAQYGSDAIAGVLNFQLKDASAGGSVELNTGMYRAGDGESTRFAGNVGLPLGAAGFANLSLEYGNANLTDRAAPRRDAVALIAAGNTQVPSDRPQAWGDPDIDDDVKAFGNFGYTLPAGVQMYAHTSYARKKVSYGVFFRNPNTRLGVFSNDRGRTLLVGDVLAARTAWARPTARRSPSPATYRTRSPCGGCRDDPNCFTFQELFPGGFTPQTGGTATDASLVGGVRGLTAGGFNWDLSGSLGLHRTDHFVRNTINASLGPMSPSAFDVGRNRQRDVNVNIDGSYAVTDRVNLAAGAEWREEQYGLRAGDRAGWAIGPYAAQGFMGGSNAVFAYSPAQAGTWSRHNVAAYGDLEVTDPGDAWTLGAAVRIEDFEDFGTTTNGKVSARVGVVRGSVSTGFRAPTPGQQHGLHIQSWFDPTVGDLVNNAVIPSISPVARLRGGAPLEPEESVNYTAGVVFGTGPFTLTADYFRIDVSRPHRHHEQLRPDGGRDRRGRGGGIRGGPEREELPVLHQRLRHHVAGHRHRLHLDAARAARKHGHQRRLQPHRHPGDGQRARPARWPAARRVRLRAAAHPLERRRDAAPRPGEPSRPAQLLQRLVRLRQRVRGGLRSLGRPRPGLLRRPAHRRRGPRRRPRAENDPVHRRAERLRHLLAGVGHRQPRRRTLQRVHAVGLQRRLLLRARRLRLGQLTRSGGPPRSVWSRCLSVHPPARPFTASDPATSRGESCT